MNTNYEIICLDHVTQWVWSEGNGMRLLAQLTRSVWTDDDGEFKFPYYALGTVEFWDEVMRPLYTEQKAFSWIAVQDGRVIAHLALMNKGTYWELGRMMALAQAPRGTMSCLVRQACLFARKNRIIFQVECSQYHTTSQWICVVVAGLRFAGIGVLDNPDVAGHNHHCYNIYFDNAHHLGPFQPVDGLLANPCGNEIHSLPHYQEPLIYARDNLTTERGTHLVSSRFHILPDFLPLVEQIIARNINKAA